MRFNFSATFPVTCEMTGAMARDGIQAASYAIQRRFAAEKWVMRGRCPSRWTARCRAVFVKWGVARFLQPENGF
jgi:hypothetical protein